MLYFDTYVRTSVYFVCWYINKIILTRNRQMANQSGQWQYEEGKFSSWSLWLHFALFFQISHIIFDHYQLLSIWFEVQNIWWNWQSRSCCVMQYGFLKFRRGHMDEARIILERFIRIRKLNHTDNTVLLILWIRNEVYEAIMQLGIKKKICGNPLLLLRYGTVETNFMNFN